MKTIRHTTRFKKDYRRERKTDPRLDTALRAVVGMLVSGAALPEKFRDHPLAGQWKDYRDCHVRPDLVLVYRVTADEVELVRLGSHSDLF